MLFHFGYDYEALIEEINEDIKEGLLQFDELIKVVRGEIENYLYKPIIDYYYEDNVPDEPFEMMTVKAVLEEMIETNRIIKD